MQTQILDVDAELGAGFFAATAQRVTLRQHLEQVDPGPHLDWRHTEAMIELGQAVLDGEVTRAMVHMPGRYGKSRTFAQGLTSCWLRNVPEHFVALLFASDKLARFHSQHARENMGRAGIELRHDSKDKSLWMLEGHHGGMWTMTIRGKPLGFGWHLGIIDDALGSYEEANRLATQEIAESAYDSFIDRLEKGRPRPALVVVATRQARRDLPGRLYDRELDKAKAEGWTVLDLPAQRRPRRVPYPDSCRVIEDSRKDGAPLCEELDPLEDVERRAGANPLRALANDGQDPPETAGGGHFRRSWLPIIGRGRDDLGDPVAAIKAMAEAGEIANPMRWLRGHDYAGGGKDAVASGGGCQLEENDGAEWIIFDPTCAHPAAAAVEGTAIRNAQRNGTTVEQATPKEGGVGAAVAASINVKLRNLGYRIHPMPVGQGKVALAQPLAAAAAWSCEACSLLYVEPAERDAMGKGTVCKCESPRVRRGKVAILMGPNAEGLRDRMHDFDGDGEDDDVDAVCCAFNAAPSTGENVYW